MPVADYQQKIREEKREAALNAGLDVFLLLGYDRASLQQIARAAGISTGTLFKHFPTKAALFEAIMLRAWESAPEYSRKPLPAGNPEKGLLLIGCDFARLLRQPMTAPLFRVIISEAPRFPELVKALYGGKGPFGDWVVDYLQSEADAGTLAIEDPAMAATQFLAAIKELIFWPYLLGTPPPDDATVEHIIRESVTTILARYGKK